MAAKGKGVSLNPETFGEGGGLLDDANVSIKEARFEMFDYQGTRTEVPSLKLTMDVGDGQDVPQNWSCGGAKDWAPSPDGKELIPIGKLQAVVLTSNVGILLKSILDSGFPADKLDAGDITILEGMECHVERVPAPKRSGLKSTKEGGFEPTILTVAKIHKLPWEKKGKGKGKGGTKGPGKGGGASEDVTETAKTTLVVLLADAGDEGLKKADLPKLVMQQLKGEKNRNAVIKEIFTDEFLGLEDGWTYAGGVITMAE